MNPLTLLNLNAIAENNKEKLKPIVLNVDGQLALIVRHLIKHGPTSSKDLKAILNTKHNVSIIVNYLMQAPYKLIERANDRKEAVAIYRITPNKTLADFGLEETTDDNDTSTHPAQSS